MSSNNDIKAEDSVTKIKGIGPKRSKHLSASTVGELAEQKAQSVYNELNQTGMTPEQVETVVATARAVAGIEDEPVVYTKPGDGAGEPVPAKAVEDDDEAIVEVTEEGFGDDVDAFVDAGDEIDVDRLEPVDCESVLIMGGDDAFDHNGEFGDATAEDLAGLVQSRLVEFGFDNVETVYAVGSGMGRKAVNAWASYTANELGADALPSLKQIAVQASGRYPSADDYRERNEAILEAVDGVCVVANGDYVGMWVNMANERDDVIIRTPRLEQDDDE